MYDLLPADDILAPGEDWRTLVLRGVLLSLTLTGWRLILGGVAESDPVDVALEFLDELALVLDGPAP